MIKVVEAFSGIGAQKQALEKAKIKHKILNTIEWDINAIYAYDIMHNKNLSPSNLSKEEIIEKLRNVTLSSDGKKPISYKGLRQLNEKKLQFLYAAIQRNRNLCDITKVTGDMIPDDTDLLTYSFPCQDLSISSVWHNKNNGGIKKGSNSRSSLLWEIGRILYEKKISGAELPKFLLMENVNSITSSKHIANFEEWKEELRKMGYSNKVYYALNAVDFGIPQSRSRTFMLSIRVEGLEEEDFCNFEKQPLAELKDFLRLDLIEEANSATPNQTKSRLQIKADNRWLAEDGIVCAKCTNTISTKQDRNPNAGVIIQANKMRYLTPRETFLLMGFPEEKFEKLKSHNLKTKYLRDSHLYRMSGNSIVVNVLVKIFEEIERLKGIYFHE